MYGGCGRRHYLRRPFRRESLLAAGKAANQEFQMLLILRREMLERQSHTNRVMGRFDNGPAVHSYIAHAELKENLIAWRKSGNRFNVASGKAQIAEVAPDGVSAFLPSEFDSASAVVTRITSAAGHRVAAIRPAVPRRLNCIRQPGDFRKIHFAAVGAAVKSKNGLVFQTLDAKLAGARRIFASYPDHTEARLLFSVLYADRLAHTDAINTQEASAPSGCIQCACVLDKRLTVTVHTPDCYVYVHFNSGFASPAHSS